MQVCNDLAECQGVTYTHKYWGDKLSKGFGKLNYGYQLRKYKDQSNKQLEDEGREFEHSWVKRATPLAYPCIMVQECGYACDTCSSNVCSNCKDGYYLESGTCKKCDSSCLTCADSSSCSSCALQHYDDSGTCKECMDKCQTCNNGDSCLIDCPTANCSKCDDTGVCQHCVKGFQLNFDNKNCESFNILLEDDFNAYTTQFDILKWTNYLDNQMSPSDAAPFTVETPMFGEQQGAQFYGNSSIGTIDSTTDISPVPYDNHIWLALDYQDKISPRNFEAGFSRHITQIMGTAETAIKTTIGPASSNWQHREVKFALNSDYKFNVNVRKNNGADTMIDNILASSTHGPNYYNTDPHNFIYKGFQIQSNDYNGFTAQPSDKQVFNFYSRDCDEALGRKDWNGEKFAMLIGEFEIIAEVILFRQSNGGRMGDSYGEFVDPASYTSQKHFTTGEWMFFSPDQASSVDQFKTLDGFSQMVGPYKRKHLAFCVNECEDFETLQEAVKRCTEIIECEGITYTHKYDGDSNSKGFAGGYGYQLRKHELQEPHADLPRHFEYTWIKRVTPVPIDSSFSNLDRAFCQNYSNNACQLCVPGYYLDGDGKCQICQKECGTCSDGVSCDSCANGFYSSASDCLQCDDNQCVTCNGDATTCIQSCPSNCLKCNGDGHCLVCEEGYMKKFNKCEVSNVVLLHDDFQNAGSTYDNTKWNQKVAGTVELIDPCTNGSKCFNLKLYGFGKEVYSLQSYDTIPYENEFFMMFDAMTLDDNPQFMVGFSTTNTGSITSTRIFTSYNSHSTEDGYINMSNKENIWNHFEGRLKVTAGTSFYVGILLNSGPSSAHFIDNFYLTSVQGPQQINRSPYLFTNPGIQILSKDYDEFTEDSAQFAQFNFDSYSLDQQMGRSDWNGEIFAVYIPFKDIKGQVRLSRTHNGGRYGDAWGRFTDLSSTYQKDHTIFRSGEYIIFGKDFTTDPTELDFENKSKICAYAGPFLSKNLQDCSDDCRDYETLHEAMEACEASGDCEGVTFAHKHWGGVNSSGFDKYLGYGYQLRKGILETHQIRRQYQTSWTKRPTKLTSDCEEITVCGQGCAQCTTGTETCTQASKGFYLDGDSKPQRCDMTKCAECSDFNTCTVPIEEECTYSNPDATCLACKLGTYRSGNQCLPCDGQCVTCVLDSDNCVLECFEGCIQCVGNTCAQASPGYYIDSGVIKTCNYELCSRCTDAVNCEVGYDIPTGCQLTNANGECVIAQGGYYVDGGNIAQECDEVCSTCTGPANTQCGSTAPGYYFPDIADKTNVQQCDHTICATCTSAVTCTVPCVPGCTLCDAQENCHATVPGYYLDGGVMTQCNHNLCATCSSATVCITPCSANCSTCNADNECQTADDGYYLDGAGAVQQCDHTICATCSSLTVCITPCQTGCTLCDSENVCHETAPGKYLDGSVLKNCDHNLCATCTSATDCIVPCEINCATCDSSNVCQSASPGYYLDSNIIKLCNKRVCATCSSYDTCTLACNSECGSCDIDGSCLSCPLGYYLDSGSCNKCQDNCLTCQNGTSCDTCKSGNFRSMLPPLCGCEENYHPEEDSLDCYTCSSPVCSECTIEGVCTKCHNANMLPPLCTTTLQSGFFSRAIIDDMLDTGLQQCSIQCSSCENTQENCLTCVQGKNRNQLPPSCMCKYGYHDFSGTSKDCSPCPSSCISCSDQDFCLECDSDLKRELNEYSHMCECINGYKEDANNECKKCYMYKGECLVKCPPTLSQNENDFICEAYKYHELDNVVLIILCGLTLLGIIGLTYFLIGRIIKKTNSYYDILPGRLYRKLSKSSSEYMKHGLKENSQNQSHSTSKHDDVENQFLNRLG